MKKKKPFIPKIVTGNDLITGTVLFMEKGENWQREVFKAEVAKTEDEADVLLKTAQKYGADNKLVDIYLVDVELTDEGPFPIEIRERIRAKGPTIEVA